MHVVLYDDRRRAVEHAVTDQVPSLLVATGLSTCLRAIYVRPQRMPAEQRSTETKYDNNPSILHLSRSIGLQVLQYGMQKV